MPLLYPGDDLGIIDHPGTAGLDPAMSLPHRLRLTHTRTTVQLGQGEAMLDLLVQRLLIALEPQHIVTALVENLLGDLPLAAHGINGHHAPSDR
jgi:hypothetical protein